MTNLEAYIKEFKRQKTLGERVMAQLSEAELTWQFNAQTNSIAIIVKHLWGNMLSRWTNFLSEDGEKEWREREAEFSPDLESREAILEKWEIGWACLFEALESLTDADLQRTVMIRNEEHLVVEAINRQLAHYGNHVGQMIILGVMQRGEDWKSLSIPRGQSDAFNAKMFGR